MVLTSVGATGRVCVCVCLCVCVCVSVCVCVVFVRGVSEGERGTKWACSAYLESTPALLGPENRVASEAHILQRRKHIQLIHSAPFFYLVVSQQEGGQLAKCGCAIPSCGSQQQRLQSTLSACPPVYMGVCA